MTGGTISQTLRRMFIPLLAASQKGFMEKMSEKDKAVINNMDAIKQFAQAVKGQGDVKTAYDRYRSLPDELRSSKFLHIMAIQLAQKLGDSGESIPQEMERFKTSYPNDRAINILSIDYYIIKKQYDKSLEAVEGLNKSIGGDPYLDFIRGNILVAMQQSDKAKEAFEKAIQAEPDMEEAYVALLGIAVDKKDHDETSSIIKKKLKIATVR